MEQRSPEWFAARAGKLTASRVHDALARTKTTWGAGRANTMAALIVERLTGAQEVGFTNAAMQWGTDQEPAARLAYEFETGSVVEEVGLVDHPTITMTGASPDGLVGDLGLVEIKCPNTATHLDTFEGRGIAAKYETQIDWQLACTGRSWCDFVSFDPRLPPDMQLVIIRRHRDAARLAELEGLVREFLAELDARLARLAERRAAA